jgi:DNA-binding response OmpR family regulator
MSSRDEQSGLILLVEDNRQIAEMVGEFLERRGYSVDYAADGVSGLHLAVSNSYDVVVLDLMLPGLDGLDVCRKLRRDAKKSTPVLMLTARDTLEDKLVGLEAGADDYLVKPFDVDELKARLRALLRRAHGEGDGDGGLTFEQLRIDPSRHGVWVGESFVELTRTEYQLLELLMLNPRRVLPHSLIYDRVWGYDFGPSSNALRVYVGYLRRKLEDAGAPPLIRTIRGVGYVLREPEGGE